MIKVIYGKAGEGKTAECIKEIKMSEAKDIAIIDTEGGLKERLENMSDLSDREITFFESVELLNGIAFDMIIIDNLDPLADTLSEARNWNYDTLIITQQMGLR